MNKVQGFKRLLLFMIIAAPMASSEPISLSQEALTYTAMPQPKQAVIKPVRINVPRGKAVKGVASWYSESDPGINLHTANGEVFDERKMTCASWHHEFGTLLKITNLANGKSVVCRVNDRGPNKRLGRIIDLTISAFRRIADPRLGLIKVSVARLS